MSDGVFYMIFHADDVKDMDSIENNPCEYNPPKAEWDDGEENDTPGFFDITWSSTVEGDIHHGPTAALTMPIGGIDTPVIWTIQLKVDDEEGPLMADDPETEVDSVQYRVYLDHLARDKSNVGDLNSQGPGIIVPNGNCFGAANHAYNGGVEPIIVPKTIGEEVFKRDPDPKTGKFTVSGSEIVFNKLVGRPIGRGDWFVYNSGGHINTSYDDKAIWEFNGHMNPARWGTSTVGQYMSASFIDGDGDEVWAIELISHHPKN